MSEFLSEGNGVKNMISLLKDKFTAEGFEESAINEEFANLTLTIHYEIRAFSLHYSLKRGKHLRTHKTVIKKVIPKTTQNSQWMESTSMSKDVLYWK